MNFIEKKAHKVVDYYLIDDRIGESKFILREVDKDLMNVDSYEDKLNYLTILLEANDIAYKKHLIVCKNPNTCSTNDAHDEVHYFLQQELNRIGVKTNHDHFTRDEKEALTDYLDKFANDLKDIKDGQQVIYDDLYEEIQELKKWFILGKKNWKQLATGKVGEMVVEGIISEGTAKPFLNMIKEELPMLLT